MKSNTPMNTYYITTAIDYPNAKPHMGHAYEKIIADALARYQRLKGKDVFFLTGVDEHGQKIEDAAKNAGKTPTAFLKDIVPHFITMCDKLNISYNRFIRTTEQEHTTVSLNVFKQVKEKGYIYKGDYEGLYCIGCEAYYLERELDNGLCPHHKKKPELHKTESYFFKLSAFQDKLVKHIKDNPEFIQPDTRRNEILTKLQEPLRDLSISRTNFTWGISVPGDEKHILYVWFDALLNYLTGVNYPEKHKHYWPPQCQQIGKDIIWFHTVIWPAILMALKLPLPKTVYAHGFLTVEGQKMSKSIGNVLDPLQLVQEFGADKVRYYFLHDVRLGEDGNYSRHAFIDRTNADLADALGNLLQRTTVMTHKYCNGKNPPVGTLTHTDKKLNKQLPTIQELDEIMHTYQLNAYIERIWEYIAHCNKYINDTTPWKADEDRRNTILYMLIEHLRNIAILVYPIIPASAEHIAKQLGQNIGTHKDVGFKTTTKGTIKDARILFAKCEYTEEPFSKLNLKIANVIKVRDHPDAKKLYILDIDLGEHKRQLVAGMKAYYSKQELTGKNIVIISNLKPAKLRGIESQGMLLAAEKDDTVKVLEAPNSKPGDPVIVDGIIPHTKQIKIEEFKDITLTTKNKHVLYNEKEIHTPTEPITVDIGDDATIR